MQKFLFCIIFLFFISNTNANEFKEIICMSFSYAEKENNDAHIKYYFLVLEDHQILPLKGNIMKKFKIKTGLRQVIVEGEISSDGYLDVTKISYLSNRDVRNDDSESFADEEPSDGSQIRRIAVILGNSPDKEFNLY